MLNATASINDLLEHNTVENLNGMFLTFSKVNSLRKRFCLFKAIQSHLNPLFLVQHVTWFFSFFFFKEFREYILIAHCEVRKRIKCLNIIFYAVQLISFFPADITKKSAKNALANGKYSNNEHLIQLLGDYMSSRLRPPFINLKFFTFVDFYYLRIPLILKILKAYKYF